MQDSRVGRKRKIIFAAASGILLSFFYAAGYLLELNDSLDLTEINFYLRWFWEAVFATGILYVLWEIVDKCRGRGWSDVISEKTKFVLPGWLCVLILLLCWLPAWFSLFPGAFAYDAFDEWLQVRNGVITSHHPVVHVLFLGKSVESIYGLTGSYNAGIAVYTFLQMFILANVLVRTFPFMREFNVPGIFQWIALLFYGLSPVMQLFAISATKDVLFSAALLIFLLNLFRFSCRKEQFFRCRKQMISFGVSAFFSMILRNNGFYIILVTLVIMVAGCGKYRKKLMCVVLGIAIAYGLYVGPCYDILRVTPGGVGEMLSVPLQQIARVHKYDYGSLEQQDLELLYRFVPKEALDSYRATVSDFVKKDFQEEAFRESKKEFFSLWWRWGVKHPLTYINSFLINTVDFWYPNAVVDGYRDAYGKSSYFDYQVSPPGEEIVLLPGIHRYYERISFDPQAQKTPFAFLALSPGWYLVMAIVIFIYLWRCRKYVFLLPGMVFLLSVLTVLLGPIALVRYVLVFYYAFPILLPLFFCHEKFEVDGDRC